MKQLEKELAESNNEKINNSSDCIKIDRKFFIDFSLTKKDYSNINACGYFFSLYSKIQCKFR